nr:PH domain-containing protein [Deinococcus aestuarii]
MAAGLLALFIWLPRRLGYALTDEGLEIRRASGTFVWPYRDLRASATPHALGVKQGGVNAPGYFSGAFAWPGEGPNTILALSSSPRGGVLVTSQGRRYFLTPADPDAFLRELRARGVPDA